jgi:hypothetical protein
MQQIQKLGLHSHIMPAVKLRAEQETLPRDTRFDEQLEALQRATVFDCRGLDYQFVRDTGRAALEEGRELKLPVRLPFGTCYFEFDGEMAVLAQEMDFPEEGRMEVEFFPYLGWGAGPSPDGDFVDPGMTAEDYAEGLDAAYGSFTNGALTDDGEPAEYFEEVNSHAVDSIALEQGAEFLSAVLTLLNDHLVASEVRPDPAPRLNSARAKKGRLPLSSETRVLTINTAAVRRAVAGKRLLKHESPRLHWRRGHWRVLHRGSEFESRAWVRRCLVGDPSRGSVHKDYRIVWNQPMLQATR